MQIKKYRTWIVLFSSIFLFVFDFFILNIRFTGELLFWFVIPIAISIFICFKPKDIGLKLFPKKEIPLIAILFLLGSGVAYYSSTLPEMASYYASYDFSLTFVALWIISLVSVEFFFRGYMLFGLERFGRYSVLIQAVPYMLIHLGKPWPEFYFSFFAGIIFGLINWRSKSFLPSFFVHLSGLEIVYLANL